MIGAQSERASASRRRYYTGYLCALLLTLVAFGLTGLATDPPLQLHLGTTPLALVFGIDKPAISRTAANAGIFALAVVQILVHLRYFLGIDNNVQNRLPMLAMAFTTLILLLMIAGSLWVMGDLDRRM